MEEWHFKFQPTSIQPAVFHWCMVTDWAAADPVCLDLLVRAPEPGEGPL